ncbi:MAG: peptidoglycan DD-metalloendopeptidase family protein [Helicobacter sp.]|uniref:peptidoglycan DD-metalloendopeptidase family protein n=1 Tax=Helicobacter sp. TaxID=218 RepID=UPI002A824D9C|nr:peptidoglycan DD-metalloendopeptidase family protein [Helicobacter sp.]MDY4426614.1 peptidoglycan DD-metalloendopeptidase family protein [Helicobacter sp.]MDY5616056.1 peptidoglycan DD-metalloendopeptidase family protein [Helicobacter sp.]
MQQVRIFVFRVFFVFGCFLSSLVAANIQESQWENGQTLLTFFEKNSIPLKVYYDLPREDKELADEIISGNTFYTLYDEEGKLLQALIPINENSQLHIYKEDATYGMRAIPIVYFEKEHNIALSVESSLYNDIVKYTGDTFLASDFIQAYKGSVNFKRQIKKGDKLAIIYERKYRLGKVFGSPNIKASILKTSNEKKYVVRFDDGNFYDLEGNNLNKYLFMIPLKYKRISSHFSMGRKHPILGYKRPHLGTDYAAPRHTPIKAASQGKVIFAGTKGGYGKTVIIQHENGYRTLYGHMHKINKGIRAGVYVSQGKQIGTVGSTGLSTGPHLHFGLYKNGSAINPQKHLRIATIKLKDKEKEKFSILAKSFQNQLETILANNLENEPFKKMQNSYIVYLSEEIGNDEDSKRNN